MAKTKIKLKSIDAYSYIRMLQIIANIHNLDLNNPYHLKRITNIYKSQQN